MEVFAVNAYNALAASYDSLTLDVDYDAVVDFYMTILEREGVTPRTALDLACGTGSVALRLAQKGLRVTAVDMSEQMLCVASEKTQELKNRPFYICQPLQELKLPFGADLAVCALDSMNYIVEPAHCKKAISRVYKHLNPGGCFIFDIVTPERLRAMDGQVFLDENEDTYCVWRGEFDEKTNILSYGMDLFQKQGKLWYRSFEEHQEYAYSPAQLVQYLKEAGFTNIEVFADRCLKAPAEGAQRIYLKARKGRVK